MDNRLYRAFTIMAFDSEFDAVYTKYIKPSLERASYEVTRADSLLNQQNILKDIIRQISNADLIIAELSTLNPNVYYELGIAHALKKRTVLLTQSIDDLPFDLRSYRVIGYSTHFDEINKLADAIFKVAEGAKSNTIVFGNPVIDFLPSDTDQIEQYSGNVSIAFENEEKGLWDYAREGESAIVEAMDFLNRLTVAMDGLNERTNARTAEFNKIKQSNMFGSASKVAKLVETSAMDILNFARIIETELPKFALAWENISENTTNLLHVAPIKSQEDKAATLQLKMVFSNIVSKIKDNIVSQKELLNTYSQMKGISKSMNAATKRVISASDQIIVEYEKALAYSVKVIDLLDEKLIAEN